MFQGIFAPSARPWPAAQKKKNMFKTFGGMMGFRKALGGPPSKLSLPEKVSLAKKEGKKK